MYRYGDLSKKFCREDNTILVAYLFGLDSLVDTIYACHDALTLGGDKASESRTHILKDPTSNPLKKTSNKGQYGDSTSSPPTNTGGDTAPYYPPTKA